VGSDRIGVLEVCHAASRYQRIRNRHFYVVQHNFLSDRHLDWPGVGAQMTQILGTLTALLVAGLALVAKFFKGKADRLKAEQVERDTREREEVARIEERIANVTEQQRRTLGTIDVKGRTDFE